MKKDGKIEEIVRRNMKKLSEKEYNVLIKLYFERKTIYSTAKELKISRNTVKYREGKAKEHLKKIILEDMGKSEIMLTLRGW